MTIAPGAAASPPRSNAWSPSADLASGATPLQGLCTFLLLFTLCVGALTIGLALGELVFGRHIVLRTAEWRCIETSKAGCARLERVNNRGGYIKPAVREGYV